MLRNSLRTAIAVAGILVAASAAQAITVITNTATANYNNEIGTAMAPVAGATTFSSESDPVLAVVKTGDKASGPSGTVVTWTVKVTYPRIADVPLICGDDSDATSVVIGDPIPAGFTYNPGTMEMSTDNGGSWTALGDGVEGVPDAGDYNVTTAGAVTVNLGTMTEGMGDAACGAAGTARLVRFLATKN